MPTNKRYIKPNGMKLKNGYLAPTNKKVKVCRKKHCHDCAGCGYERPMTKFEREISKELNELLSSSPTNKIKRTK